MSSTGGRRLWSCVRTLERKTEGGVGGTNGKLKVGFYFTHKSPPFHYKQGAAFFKIPFVRNTIQCVSSVIMKNTRGF